MFDTQQIEELKEALRGTKFKMSYAIKQSSITQFQLMQRGLEESDLKELLADEDFARCCDCNFWNDVNSKGRCESCQILED